MEDKILADLSRYNKIRKAAEESCVVMEIEQIIMRYAMEYNKKGFAERTVETANKIFNLCAKQK